MKSLILVLTFVTPFALITKGQDMLEWSERRKLAITDFKGARPDPLKKQTLIAAFGLKTDLENSQVEKLENFNSRVTNLFSSKDSWLDTTERSRLRYAITLFDLNEWKARELRKRLNENRRQVLTGQYRDIEQTVSSEFEKIRQSYDIESDFGNNPIEQMNWETKISERLYSLTDFCRLCGSNKH